MKRIMVVFMPIVALALSFSGCGGGQGPSSAGVNTGSTNISWNMVTTNADGSQIYDLAGYRVYYSLSSPVTKNNSTVVDVGNTTAASVGNLVSGKTYYFRVSSYDTSGLESTLSNEEVGINIL